MMGATRDGCFLGKTNVCKPPHLCHLPKRRAHNWPTGPALQTACLWALPMVARGQLGWCPVAHLVSGAAMCPGCAFAPAPAGGALLSHTCPRASMSGLLLSSTRPARPWLKHLLLPLLLLSILLGLLWGTSVTLVLLIRKECRAHVLLPLGLSAGFLPQRSGVGGPLASPQLASGSFPMARCQQQGHPCSAPFRDVSAVPIGVGQQHQVRQRHACL